MNKKNSLDSLSKVIAQSGFCARRKATKLIKNGMVTVNGRKIIEPGHKINFTDKIKVNDQPLQRTNQNKKIYILLNKPKGYITTVSDELGRKTVMELLGDTGNSRLYPVGRLDRNSTGLLLLTNDGYLAEKLAHPRNEVRKTYHITLDRRLHQSDFQQIKNGIMLEDGMVTVDAVSYLHDPCQVRITLHSGRYRVLRRLFELLSYEVLKLDRTEYAGLTKNRLSIGLWRHLEHAEVDQLYQEVNDNRK